MAAPPGGGPRQQARARRPALATGLRCGECGTDLIPSDPVCPGCGAHLLTALCGRCGFRGPREEFRHHRCPVCGHRWDLGGRGLPTLLIAGAALLILFLAFALAR